MISIQQRMTCSREILPHDKSSRLVYSGHSEARRERSELYGREYDQEKATYNDIYFQQKSLWPIFFLFFFPEVVTGSWRNWLGTAIHWIWVSLVNVTKWEETCVNKCHEHILLIIFIICYWFTYIFIFWYSFFNGAVKDFWRDYR